MQKFAVVLIGGRNGPVWHRLQRELIARTRTLRRVGEQFRVLGPNQLGALTPGTRAACVVLCRTHMRPAETSAIKKCLALGLPVFPVVPDLKRFNAFAPESVAALNGYELASPDDTGELVGLMLETLGLQRSKRKIFISYARVDSADIARQLREAFTARWYSVFLDTISIRPGAEFQKELLQELADSDVMVLLNSPSIDSRPYVLKEIAFADQARLGGIQVTWPNTKVRREGGFFQSIELDGRLAQRRRGRVTALKPAGIKAILRTVAGLRTALQERREMELVRPIETYAKSRRWRALFHPGRYIELKRRGRQLRLDLAVGLPTSRDLERAHRNAAPRTGPGRLVYDPLGITNELADHLEFLRDRLRLQYLDPKDTKRWTLIR